MFLGQSALWKSFRIACHVSYNSLMASLSKLFGLWREVVDEAVESERYGALHWMASGLARALRRWQAAVKAGGDGRRVLGKRFFLESQDITVGQVWRRWRTNALSQAVPRMLSRFVFQWTQRLGTSSFDRWRGLCHEVRQQLAHGRAALAAM